MNFDEFKNQLIAIQPGNIFLEYIADRINDDNYRGLHISQHNRYDLNRLIGILSGIYCIIQDKKFRIPLGDDNGENDANCYDYYEIVKEVKTISGIGTINSLKKNFFVDFQRMGLLERFDVHNNIIQPLKKGHVYSAKLTERAINLIETDSIQERYRIFTDALEDLFTNAISNIANLLYYSNYKNDFIGILEFMFIITDDRPGINQNKIKLIDSFRSLNNNQKEKAVNLIKEYCNPINFIGDKTNKRDFENWKNESQQIFTLLKNTVYFDITQNSLKLNTGMYGIFNDSQIKMRSLGVKQEYFKEHDVAKQSNFELHHIVPFSKARNKIEFKMIDNWRNLIYLEHNKHSQITKKRDKNIILVANETQADFIDIDNNNISAKNGIETVYNKKLAKKITTYNNKILKEFFQYSI